jgi:RimJ/RimL family protein N-acetyltransferase
MSELGFASSGLPQLTSALRHPTPMPEVETERLLLRMFRPEDGEVMYERLWTDPLVMRYVQPGGWPHPREESAAMMRRLAEVFAERGFGQWAVVPKETGELIGYCGLKYLDQTPEVELLYGITPPYWNRGLVTEAARATLRFAFERTELQQVVAIALPDNVGSWRVMEKVGMRREGMARHYGFDVVRYAIAREEFDAGGAFYAVRES